MSRGTDLVVVTPAGHAMHAVPATAVHHRDFPEVSGEGETPEEAALRLADRLAGSLDSAPSDWRRERIERAIEDVRAFAGRVRGKRRANPDR